MACDPAPTIQLPLWIFPDMTYPEDTIDMEITVRTLKGIHNFRKDHTSQKCMCGPWGLQLKLFLLLRKKMRDLYEGETEHCKFFSHQPENIPIGPIPHHLSKLHKLTPKRKRNVRAIPKKARRKLYSNANGLLSQLILEQADDSLKTWQMEALVHCNEAMVMAAPANSNTIPAINSSGT